MKRNNYINWFACLLGLSTFAHAQATPTATRDGSSAIQVGMTGSYIHRDQGLKSGAGLGVYGTYDITRHFGVEGDVHFNITDSKSYTENSYLIGPRYVFHKNRYHPYVKALFGLGTLQAGDTFRYKYAAYDFGGGLDFNATSRISIRAIDFEYQRWPKIDLNPYLITVGVAYKFR